MDLSCSKGFIENVILLYYCGTYVLSPDEMKARHKYLWNFFQGGGFSLKYNQLIAGVSGDISSVLKSFPRDLFLEIFSYLTYEELCKVIFHLLC